MAVPDLILNAGTILVTQSSSLIGIEMISQGFQTGLVALVNDLSDSSAVNDTIVFRQSDVIAQLKYDSVIYYLVYERENIFKENPPL
jgi:hypothetical protein